MLLHIKSELKRHLKSKLESSLYMWLFKTYMCVAYVCFLVCVVFLEGNTQNQVGQGTGEGDFYFYFIFNWTVREFFLLKTLSTYYFCN